MIKKQSIVAWLTLIWSLFTFSYAYSSVEVVYIAKVMDNDDNAIIIRRNGEAYLIEKGVGCLSLWQYEGKEVLITSPGLFLGIGAHLLIPDSNQKCKIWNSEFIGQWNDSTRQKSQKLDSPEVRRSNYYIEASYNDEIFIINGEKYEAKTYCFDMQRGDPVIFLEGSPLGVCVSAVILNLRTQKECRCWCE